MSPQPKIRALITLSGPSDMVSLMWGFVFATSVWENAVLVCTIFWQSWYCKNEKGKNGKQRKENRPCFATDESWILTGLDYVRVRAFLEWMESEFHVKIICCQNLRHFDLWLAGVNYFCCVWSAVDLATCSSRVSCRRNAWNLISFPIHFSLSSKNKQTNNFSHMKKFIVITWHKIKSLAFSVLSSVSCTTIVTLCDYKCDLVIFILTLLWCQWDYMIPTLKQSYIWTQR